jgi:polyvinyl alcohol dehydrogenase (cytochrome)
MLRRKKVAYAQPLAPLVHAMLLLASIDVSVPVAWAQAPAQVSSGTSGAASPAAQSLMSGTEFGFAVFQQNCTACHGNPAVERAPTPEQLRQFPAERIYDALNTGPMKAVGDTLTDQQKRQVSESLAGKPLGSAAVGDAQDMPNRCLSNAPMTDPARSAAWNGWGANLSNTRFQSAADAGISADTVSGLKLKWAFGLPNSTSSYSQPTVVSGRVFVGSDTGYIYSLDAKSGCVYWSYQSKAAVRNAMTIGPIRGQGAVRYAVYYGDLKANVYALDAQTGRLLWVRNVEPHYTDRVTAAPALYRGRLFVPVSSWEEFAAASPGYPCCSSVGSVVALDTSNGRQLWKTYVIAERPHAVRKNAIGTQLWAPAGAAVWNTPTIDPKRGAVYFGTGDATTYPAALTSDSVMAVNLNTGRVLWSYQVYQGDSFLGGCSGPQKTDNCPKVQGPDWDIPSSVILRHVGDKDMLVVGTKPGDILALDPDHKGRLVWRVNIHGQLAADTLKSSPEGAYLRMSGVLWGGSADNDAVFYGLTGGGLAAVRLADGERIWLSALQVPEGEHVSHAAATTSIPGAVFVGGSDGKLTAVASADGQVLWQFETKRSFEAVNRIATRGGSISSPGAVVAGGMVFVGSGYAVLGGTPGNALLAFATD